MRRGLCSSLQWIHGVLLPVDDKVINAVFDVGACIRLIEETLCIRLVLRKQERNLSFTEKVAVPQLRMRRLYDTHASGPVNAFETRLRRPLSPRPGIPEPQCRQHMKGHRLIPPVDETDLDQ